MKRSSRLFKHKDKGMYENTMIIFTNDHGDYLGNHGFIGKGSYYCESSVLFLANSIPYMSINYFLYWLHKQEMTSDIWYSDTKVKGKMWLLVEILNNLALKIIGKIHR